MNPPPCAHGQFAALVEVTRLDGDRYVADVRVQCYDCKQMFTFLGVPPGLAIDRPTVSADGLALRLPLAPQIVTPTLTLVKG
jgi:hypothetical protein